MITGAWFLENIKDLDDINKYKLESNEIRELETYCKNYLEFRGAELCSYRFTKNDEANKEIINECSNYFGIYAEVLKRIKSLRAMLK